MHTDSNDLESLILIHIMSKKSTVGIKQMIIDYNIFNSYTQSLLKDDLQKKKFLEPYVIESQANLRENTAGKTG